MATTINSSRESILIIDADYRHAIDMVRSLGAHNYAVDIVVGSLMAPATRSRYVRERFCMSLTGRSLDEQVATIQKVIRRGAYSAVIAAGLPGWRLLSYGKAELSQLTRIPAPHFQTFCFAEDKARSMQFAQEIGVPCPRTFVPAGPGDVRNLPKDLAFPLVIKAVGGQGHVSYASNGPELEGAYRAICAEVPEQCREGRWPMIQEYIQGPSHGFYALVNHGELRASFMHRRIHTVPPSGGASSLASSYWDDELAQLGARILCSLSWHGVAMVEFKKDERDGQYKLIEINPKFWGSLGLSIAAGVDFPYLLVRMALDGDIACTPAPRAGLTYQWLSMDMAHAWAVRKPWLWLMPMLNGTPNDFRLADPLPSLALVVDGFTAVVRGQRRVHSRGNLTPGPS